MSCLRDVWRTIDPQTWLPASTQATEALYRRQRQMTAFKRVGIIDAQERVRRLQQKGKQPPPGLVNFVRQSLN